MTPKEKAQDLVEKMDIDSGSWQMDVVQVKECALVCADETLKARNVGNTGVVLDKEYWEEVEKEIIKL